MHDAYYGVFTGETMRSLIPIVTINGREAVPIRALLAITSGSLGEDYLIDILMRGTEVGKARLQNMCAYEFIEGVVHPVPISEWHKIGTAMQTLFDNTDPNYSDFDLAMDAWHKHVISAFPAGTFVWRDEFERAWQADQQKDDSRLPDLNYGAIQDSNHFGLVMKGFSYSIEPHPITRKRMEWNQEALNDLYEKSIQPGMTQEKLASEYGTTRQNISKQLMKCESRYGRNLSNAFATLTKK
jgi:hypothetical protein